MKTNPYFFRTALVFLAMLYLAGCSGDNTQLAGGAGGTGMSHGVMTKGSVIVNGVSFNDTAASISIDDDSTKTESNLQSGMVVSVRGTVDDTGREGTAQQVVAQSEVRGTVTEVFSAENPPRIVVLGQNVLIDDQTVLSDTTRLTLDALVNVLVEVHGLRDTQQNIRATRVEVNPNLMGGISTMDEIRGVVTLRANATDMLFNVGTQVVNATDATIDGSFTNGSIVEVHCTARPCLNLAGEFQASLIEVEDNNVNRPAVGQRFEVEGLVSGIPVGDPNNFDNLSVNGVRVQITATTTFRGGIKTDLANNIKVEAEGTWNGATLTARKIEFKRAVVRLQGVVIDSATNTFTLQIGDDAATRTITVETDSFTQGVMPSPGPACIQVRGQSKAGVAFVVIAGEIGTTCSQGDDHVLQAPLEAKADPSLTVLGFPVNVGAVGIQFRDINNTLVSRSAFFSLISAADPTPPPVAGSLVRIRFNNTNLTTISEVELED